MTVVAVTGLRAEARIARNAGFVVICAGGDPRRTAAALGPAIAAGAQGFVSFGIAGGLAPELCPGTVVVGQAVIAADGTRYAADPDWTSALQRGTGAIPGDIFGGEAIVATAAEKAILRARSHAMAVDLESLVVAQAAQRAKLPYAVLRAIADPASRTLPPAALLPLSPDGTPRLPRVLLSILRGPRQIAGLIRTARDTQCALRALARCAPVIRRTLPEPPP